MRLLLHYRDNNNNNNSLEWPPELISLSLHWVSSAPDSEAGPLNTDGRKSDDDE